MCMLPLLLRLCWKEFRLGWQLLAAGLVLPPVAAYLADNGIKWLRLSPLTVVVFVLMLAVTVWSAMLASQSRPGRSYAGVHFPLHPALDAIANLLSLGGIVLLISVNVWWWWCIRGVDTKQLIDLFQYPLSSTWQSFLWFMTIVVLYFAANFAISFVVSRSFSSPAGIVAGLIWTLGNYWVLGLPSRPGYFNMASLGSCDWHIQFMTASLAAALVALALIIGPVRLAFPVRRVLACVILGLTIIGYPLYNTYAASTDGSPWNPIYSVDGSLAVGISRSKINGDSDSLYELQFDDFRNRRVVLLQFTREVLPVGFLGREAVVVAQQKPGERRITLLRWSLAANTVEELAFLPARRRALKAMIEYSGGGEEYPNKVSPDQRTIILTVPSMVGGYNDDLWRIDVPARKATLLQPVCAANDYNVMSWQGDRVIISGASIAPFSVSLATGRITTLRLPVTMEEEQ